MSESPHRHPTSAHIDAIRGEIQTIADRIQDCVQRQEIFQPRNPKT